MTGRRFARVRQRPPHPADADGEAAGQARFTYLSDSPVRIRYLVGLTGITATAPRLPLMPPEPGSSRHPIRRSGCESGAPPGSQPDQPSFSTGNFCPVLAQRFPVLIEYLGPISPGSDLVLSRLHLVRIPNPVFHIRFCYNFFTFIKKQYVHGAQRRLQRKS